MKRREVVVGGLSLLCVGVVGATRTDELQPTAGRLGRLDDAGTDANRSAGDASGGGDAGGAADDASDASATAEGAGADAGAAAEGDASAGADEEPATIEVLSTTSGETDVRLRLVRARDDAVVHDHVRSFEYGERAYLSGHCERGETYAFTLAVDGAVLVRETIAPGERAMFELLDETTVSVVA